MRSLSWVLIKFKIWSCDKKLWSFCKIKDNSRVNIVVMNIIHDMSGYFLVVNSQSMMSTKLLRNKRKKRIPVLSKYLYKIHSIPQFQINTGWPISLCIYTLYSWYIIYLKSVITLPSDVLTPNSNTPSVCTALSTKLDMFVFSVKYWNLLQTILFETELSIML